jgi:predicted SAM-dependent methyltransferase
MAITGLLWDLMRRLNTLRRELANRRSRYLLRQHAKRLCSRSKPVRVVIGAGSTSSESWLITDLPILDALNPAHWGYIFPRGSIDRILAEHVIEHWTEDEFRLFLRVVRPFLSEQGFMRIAVPDGFHPDSSYIDYVKPGGSGSGAEDHKVLYNHITITRVLSEEQYDYDLLEYFDEAGQFHCSLWETSNGFVERSADHDPRNEERPLSYTSLIVDAQPRGGKYGL